MSGDTSYTVPLSINGKDVTAKSTFAVNSPATTKDLWNCSSASKEDALAAIAAAEAAFPGWSRTKPSARRDILLRAAELFAERSKDFAEIMKEEVGFEKPFTEFIMHLTTEHIKDTASRITTHAGGYVPVCDEPGMNAISFKEPYGVIFTIAPW